MPKTARPVPSYRLHKPSGQARVILHGRHVYLGPYGSQESRAKYVRLIGELSAGSEAAITTIDLSAGPRSDFLVLQLCAAFWEHAKTYYVKDGRPSGWLDHIKLVLRLVRTHYGTIPAGDFGPLCLKALQSRLVEAGHSRKYINKLLAVVPRMFKWGASEQLVPSRVYHDLRTVEGLRKGRTPAPDHPPVLPVADEVVDATLPHLPQVVADMVRLQRFTGMRPGEVCRVRPCDVDRSGDVWLYRVPGHKTEHFGRERVVCIGPRGQEVLRPYLLRAADAYCFSPAESEAQRHEEMRAARKTKVQPSQRHRRKPCPKRAPRDCYVKDTYRRTIARAIKKANEKIVQEAAKAGTEPELTPHWHPNQLRHSKATEVRKLFGLEAAQVTLGHAHARITEVYAERDAKLAADIARKIG